MADIFVPLNSFKSVITQLTGDEDSVYTAPNGVSSIILSAQITNLSDTTQSIDISINSNREIPDPDFSSIVNNGEFISASALLSLNREFLKKETSAYIQFTNNLSDSPFPFTSSVFESSVQTAVDAVISDIITGGTIKVKKAALSFYDKNGIPLIQDTRIISASSDAILYATELSTQILINESVTGSANVDRLYQTAVTQSYDEDLIAEVGSIEVVEYYLQAISETIVSPIRIPQPKVKLVDRFIIPKKDSFSPIISGKLVLEERFSLVMSGSQDMTVVLSILESANE